MKIGIDVRMIFPFQTGIGNYRRSLIEALFQIDKESEYILIGNSEQQSAFGKQLERENVSFSVIKSKANNSVQHLLLPFELNKLGLDIFYTTHWGATLFMPGKYVLEIPDLIYHHYPEFGSWKSKLYEFFLEKRIARNADAIVTISNFVKNDIVTMLGIDEDKVVNIKGAAAEEYRIIEDEKYIDGVLKKYGLWAPITPSPAGDRHHPDNPPSVLRTSPLRRREIFLKGDGNMDYFVYLGNQRPHKNLVGLLQAFEEFRREIAVHFCHPELDEGWQKKNGNVALRQAQGDIFPKLVIIGGVDAKGRNKDSKRIVDQLERMKHKDDVMLLGRVDREPTAAILNRAIALVHPTLHEGFGLTPLEAMSCGCPVITSNITSVPEVVEDAGILVNPRDINEISEAMGKIYSESDFRKELSVKSLERAKEFSWEKTARMLLEVFRGVV